MHCIICDLDGTIADLKHRLGYIQNKPKNWRAFEAGVIRDTPIPLVMEIVKATAIQFDATIILASGRSDKCRKDTEDWLEKHFPHYLKLYMRKAGDYRQDYIVKGEILDQILADGFTPLVAFDDRNQVVDMWRARGIPCMQVAKGDF